MWAKAQGLFPRAAQGLATAASVEAAFPALQLLLERLQAAHPVVFLHAFRDDVVLAGSRSALAGFLADATEWGARIDADLAPHKCVGWAPAGAPAPVWWVGAWGAEVLVQFAVPLGMHKVVSTAVDRQAGGMRELTDAILALPPTDLQAQLLLLRLFAGPRTNYCLLGLSLVAGARLAGLSTVKRDGPWRRFCGTPETLAAVAANRGRACGLGTAKTATAAVDLTALACVAALGARE